MNKKLLGSLVLSSLSAIGCQQFNDPYVGEQVASVLVTTSEQKLDGGKWDLGGEVAPIVGRWFGFGPSWSSYPDIALLIISADGVIEYTADRDRWGFLKSLCDDKLVCRFPRVQLPEGYYAVLAIDLDLDPDALPLPRWLVGLYPDMVTHDWIGGVIFTDSSAETVDQAKVDAIETVAREYLEGKVKGVPPGRFPVFYRKDCRGETPCKPTAETGTASFQVDGVPEGQSVTNQQNHD